jgi:hypothetical protein
MGEVIDFKAYLNKKRQSETKPSRLSSLAETIKEADAQLGPCPTCSAPVYAFPDFENIEYIHFAPGEIKYYLETVGERQSEAVEVLAKDAARMEKELEEITERHGKLYTRVIEYELKLDNDNLARVLSDMLDNPEEHAALARKFLDERAERNKEREGDST